MPLSCAVLTEARAQQSSKKAPESQPQAGLQLEPQVSHYSPECRLSLRPPQSWAEAVSMEARCLYPWTLEFKCRENPLGKRVQAPRSPAEKREGVSPGKLLC